MIFITKNMFRTENVFLEKKDSPDFLYEKSVSTTNSLTFLKNVKVKTHWHSEKMYVNEYPQDFKT